MDGRQTLDSVRKLGREGNVGDRDIIEDNVELARPTDEIVAYQPRNGLAHRDDLSSGELGNDGLENLVDDRGKDALVVVGAEFAVAEVREELGLQRLGETRTGQEPTW